MHPFSLFVVINKTAVCEDLHVMRKSRLRYIQFLQQITSALLPMLESKHDRKAVLIRERLYFFDVFSESHDFHLREMYILYHIHLQLSMCEYNIVSKSSPPQMGVWEPFSDIYLTATTTPTSNSATQLIDIYRGNSTLTLFEPDCPWISYREAFCLSDAKLPDSPKTAVYLSFRGYFSLILDINTTVSTWCVFGNKSTGCTFWSL